MPKFLRRILLLDLLEGLWVTFRAQHPKHIYTEQYPEQRPHVPPEALRRRVVHPVGDIGHREPGVLEQECRVQQPHPRQITLG